jgi:hypothetical protein
LIQVKAGPSVTPYNKGAFTITALPQSGRTMDQQRVANASRIAREKRTIEAMLAVYCRAHHAERHGLCAACNELMRYAVCRLDRCPFGAAKTSCAQCPIHCYSPTMRTRVKEVMRYAGPRMLWRHPLLALRHSLDAFRGGRIRTKGKRKSAK